MLMQIPMSVLFGRIFNFIKVYRHIAYECIHYIASMSSENKTEKKNSQPVYICSGGL